MSAAPTFAEVWTQTANVIGILENLDQVYNQDATNVLGQMDTLIQSLEGVYTPSLAGPLSQLRGRLSGAVSPAQVRALLTPCVYELGRVIGAPEGDVPSILSRLYDYMIDNSQSVNARAFSYGSVSAGGGNTGNGTVLRLTVDENNEPIEAAHAEARTAKCVRDARIVDEHREQFEFYGVEAEPDFMEVLGSGQSRKVVITASDAIESAQLIDNPSFSFFSGTADSAGAITEHTGWTVTNDVANIDIDTAITYRDFRGDPGPYSAQFTASDKLSQVITRELSFATPYWLQAAIYRPTGVTGNVVLHMGSVTRTVALSSLTVDQWTIVGILSSPGQNCWLKNWNEADAEIAVEFTSLSGGSAYADDVLFVPFKRFDGLWYCVVPNNASNTPFLKDDVFTWTDSISSDALIQKWFWRAGFGYLPSDNSGTETISDPSV